MTSKEESIITPKIRPKWIPLMCPVCRGHTTVNYGKEICKVCKGEGYLKVPPEEEYGNSST
jgi:hypothetical protein